MRIFKLNVWCYNREAERLGLADDDLWLPMAVNLDSIDVIKSNGVSLDSIPDNLAVVYINGSSFITSVEYDIMLNLWKGINEN